MVGKIVITADFQQVDALAGGGELAVTLLDYALEGAADGAGSGHIDVQRAECPGLEKLAVQGRHAAAGDEGAHGYEYVALLVRDGLGKGPDADFPQGGADAADGGIRACLMADEGDGGDAGGRFHRRHALASGLVLGGYDRAGVRRIEGVADADGDAGLARRRHGWCVQHLGAVAGHVERSAVADGGDAAGGGHVPRVGGHDAGNVGPDLKVLGAEGGGVQRCAVVRAAAAEGGGLAAWVSCYEAGGHEDAGHGIFFYCFRDCFVCGLGVCLSAAWKGAHQVSGVQPGGFEALCVQLAGEDAGRQYLSELLDYGGDAAYLAENGLAVYYGLLAVGPGKEAADYGYMAVEKVVQLALGVFYPAYFYEGVCAAFDGGADEDDAVPRGGALDYVEHAGHRGGVFYR